MSQTDYGWYSVKEGGRQGNGFFVNSKNQILYWPKKKAPGYIVDSKTAEEIQGISQGDANKKGAYSAGMGVALIFVSFVYRDHSLHEQFRFLTENISRFPASLLAIIFAGLLMGLPAGYFQRKEIANLLENGRVIDMPRPKAQFLKPSALRSKPYNPSNTRKVFVYLFVLSGAAMGISAKLKAVMNGRLNT
ncbi:MAG: hypothetical protein WCD70_06230 [Alphaproteobacteria bacterium]